MATDEIHHAIAPDGARLAWWSYGDGRPLLLVAGQAVDHRSWRLALPVLLPGRRVIICDHRGIGASSAGVRDRYTTPHLAEDLVAVLDDAGAERADVLGHSMGGRVSQWLAAAHPDRVGRLVLVSTSPGDRHAPARDSEVDRLLRTGDVRGLAQLFWPDRDWVEDLVSLLAVGGDATARARHFRASRHHDSMPVLGRIAAPTLVLHGELDRLTPVAQARRLSRAIPQSRLMILKGAGHGVVLDGGAGAQIADAWLSRTGV